MTRADQAIHRGDGGTDDEEKQRLLTRLGELKALEELGAGPAHPGTVAVQLHLAKELDQADSYNKEDANTEIAAYLDGLQQQLEATADGPALAGLLSSWRRELKRDDGFEAVIQASLDPAGGKQGLQAKLGQYREALGFGAR